MKTRNKFRVISTILTILLLVITTVPMRSMAASQPKVNLGTTE